MSLSEITITPPFFLDWRTAFRNRIRRIWRNTGGASRGQCPQFQDEDPSEASLFECMSLAGVPVAEGRQVAAVLRRHRNQKSDERRQAEIDDWRELLYLN